MKKFFLFLIAVAMVPGLAFGQATKAQNPTKGQFKPQLREMNQSLKTPATTNKTISQKTLKLPADKNGGIYKNSMVSNYFVASNMDLNYLQFDSYKTAYDPISNVLLYAFTIRTYLDPEDESSPLRGQIWLYKSLDRGATWEKSPIKIIPDGDLFLVCPSIEIANPYKTKNIDSLVIAVNAQTWDFTRSAWTGCYNFRMFKGVTSKYLVKESLIPEASWYLSSPMAVTRASGDALTSSIISWAQLYSENRDNMYCVLVDKTVNNGNMVSEEPQNVMPNAWGLSNFSPDPSSVGENKTVWSQMNGACDNEGNAYVMLYNYNAKGSEDSPRLPSVSKSTDLGLSWSDLNWCPYESLTSSMKVYDNTIVDVADVYWWNDNGTDIVAVGDDKVSMARRCWIKYVYVNEENKLDSTAHYGLIEFNKDGNVWSANPITRIQRDSIEADVESCFRGLDWAYRAYYDDPQYPSTSQSLIFRGTNSEEMPWDSTTSLARAQEVQISKTPSGDLVAKWIDFTGYDDVADLERFPHVQLLNSEQYIDSLLKTDVYMSYRKAGQNKWSDPLRVFGNNVPNVFDYSTFYPKKGTFIPRVVPSINEIPLFDLVVDTTWDADRQEYPRSLQELGSDGYTAHLLICHKVALDSSWTPVIETPSVELQSNIGEIYPNPANDRIEFSFTLSRPAFVNIEIFNSVGEKLALVHNGTVNFSANAVSFNGVKDFPSGVYYCVVTIDGQKTTRKFTVAR